MKKTQESKWDGWNPQHGTPESTKKYPAKVRCSSVQGGGVIGTVAWFHLNTISLTGVAIRDSGDWKQYCDIRLWQTTCLGEAWVLVSTGRRRFWRENTCNMMYNSGFQIYIFSPLKLGTRASMRQQSCPQVGWISGSRFCRILAGRVGFFSFFYWLFLGTWIDMNLWILHSDLLIFYDI